ncbi:Heme-binding protein A [Lachnellula suecica]|uniref:Heme-binding protein A n=1 Tax=Lachnellula suecica TaxID=602035 RepID=A0A8T9CDY1_9HELO|nr:Heme-binding protein A [Lachnellula suecica]
MDTTDDLRAAAAAFGDEPLLLSPDGQVITLARGYIPLLVNFTFEDKAAKGLRKRKAGSKPEPPVYLSALELVRDHRVFLLSGPSGSGKTSFAKHLCFRLSNTGSIESSPLIRNEDGVIHDEQWEGASVIPCYFMVDGPESFKGMIDNTLHNLVRCFTAERQATNSVLLIVIDTIEKAEKDGPVLLAELLALVKRFENIKLLLLGETTGAKHWRLPSEVVCHDLLPLLEAQRRQAISTLTQALPSQVAVGIGAAAATPAYFALALEARHRGDQIEEPLDAWLAVVAPDKVESERAIAQAFDNLQLGDDLQIHAQLKLSSIIPNFGALSGAVQRLLAARYLANLPVETAITLFQKNPVKSEPILRSLLTRLDTVGKSLELVEGLLRGSGITSQLGALLVSDFVPKSSQLQTQISSQMLAIIEESTLPVVQRAQAGQILSRQCDPRDLTALTNVPAGSFIFGSETHPNSQPPERISLEAFRVGLYPVVNRDFSLFARETGLDWQSPDGFASETQNSPATDLSWYDARSYCEWLTRRWRLSGKITYDEHVRLPTEPEWERASRGDQISTESEGLVYPWGTEWKDDTANYEGAGLNTSLFVLTMVTETLRISLEKVDFRPPTQVTDDTSVLTLKNLVFEPLLKWQPGGLAHPALFDRWEHSPDGRIWHFHIRKNAVFHDGEACVASHVIDFINAILDSRDTFGMRWSYHRYFAHTKFTAEDGLTIKIENPEPIADILDIFTEFYICRVASDGQPVLGTGRYSVIEFDKEESRAVLERVRPRDGEGNGPRRIIATAEPSAEERLRQLLDGRNDAAMNLERVEGELHFDPRLQWSKAQSTLSIIYYLNCCEGIFTSPEARLAVNYAVDTVALARDVFQNLAVPSATVASPFHLGAREAELEPISFDATKARELLEKIDTTTPIVLRTPTYMPERAEAITRFVASALEAMGLKVVVEVEADRPNYARQIGLEKNIGDLALFDSSPHSTYRILDDKISSTTKAVWWQGYQDAEVDRLIKVANGAVEESDREEAYRSCLERLRENPPWLFLLHPVEVFAARLDLQGLSLSCKGVLNIE